MVYERAKSGRGQAVSIVADAGMGKSRLLYEFRKAMANEEVTFLEGKCLSYSRGVAYHPVIDLLKGNFDIRENDGDPEVRDKVKQGPETPPDRRGQHPPLFSRTSFGQGQRHRSDSFKP